MAINIMEFRGSIKMSRIKMRLHAVSPTVGKGFTEQQAALCHQFLSQNFDRSSSSAFILNKAGLEKIMGPFTQVLSMPS